jgi:hypothetical protein
MATERVEENKQEITELDFDFDNFHKQKVLKGTQAYARLLMRLIRKRKGTNPSDPEMGIDLDSYRFSEINSVATTLCNEIRRQATKYIPMLTIESISAEAIKVHGDYVLYIHISLLISKEEIILSFTQQNKAIIDTKIEVLNKNFINTKGSD